MPSMAQEELLSMLRQLEPEEEPSIEQLLLDELLKANNQLDDLKQKQNVTNELLIDLLDNVKKASKSIRSPQDPPRVRRIEPLKSRWS